MDALRLSS